MSDSDTATEKTWVGLGANGVVGTIVTTGDSFQVKVLKGSRDVGAFPSLEVAKAALTAMLAENLEFREH